MDGFNGLYNITYSNSLSGSVCYSVMIPTSSCVNGICKHEFNVSSSVCLNTSDINVTVTVDSPYLKKSSPIKIGKFNIAISGLMTALLHWYVILLPYADAVNTFINVTFDKVLSRIHIEFINQPKQGEKFYSVRYGPVTPGCGHLPWQTKGHLSNLNSLSLELNILESSSMICFIVKANNGTNFVSVEGIYNTGEIMSKSTLILT